MKDLNRVEISKNALTHNIKALRRLIGGKLLCPCVKANAYGHGLAECGKIFLEAGADWLSVNSLYEADTLREAGITAPIYILGYVPLDSLEYAVKIDCRLVVYNREVIKKLGEIGKKIRGHLKVETGNNRQGIKIEDLVDFARFAKSFENIELEGLTTHFANIEDTTNHSFARIQLERFIEACKSLDLVGIKIPIRHCANSAATILFPETRFEMVRVGLSAYGMWPSKDVKNKAPLSFELSPALTWKTKIVQIKGVKKGEYVGYGCTYKADKDIILAVLGAGYYDGYDRGISNKGHVLVKGKRAPVLGRICMNLMMVDITGIPNVKLEDDAVLLGRDGDETVSAELFADWADTINYEIPTRINDRIERVYLCDTLKT